MKKLLLLCALLSLGINAAPSVMCVLDIDEICKQIKVIGIKENLIENAIEEWAKENNQFIIFQKSLLLFRSSEVDATKEFIDWLKKKYTCTKCLLHCQKNH